MSRIVVALGGNALGNSPEEQLILVKNTVKPIAELIKSGHEVLIAHGNGPQVGMINLVFETAEHDKVVKHAMPFPECGAMSQGYIGYHLQNALREELNRIGIHKEVATLVTEVEVDANDPAFDHPSKPIGAFCSEAEAKVLEAKKGYIMKEDSGRGYRRVVASPKPIGVVGIDVVRCLVKAGHIVITVGGGGIPVAKTEFGYLGLAAVIDKDFASQKLAQLVEADFLFILTAVDRVAINFNKPNQKEIDEMDVATAKQYIQEGHFAKGSMLPKVEAAILFAESKPGRIAIIASLEKAALALEGKTGTKITL